MKILAIDPGNKLSAYVVYDGERILDKGKIANEELLQKIYTSKLDQDPAFDGCEHLAIEMIASYGMAVGETVFETVLWIGRFIEAWTALTESEQAYTKVKRMEVKMNLCHNAKAKDGNIRQALIDRFGEPGTKKNPGPTYGISADVWAALGVAVTWWDKHTPDVTSSYQVPTAPPLRRIS